jgi:hypothetical protein
MNVFIATNYEDIGGVFLTLEDAIRAMKEGFHNRFSEDQTPDWNYDEYQIGFKGRLRSYDRFGRLWWEHGERVP